MKPSTPILAAFTLIEVIMSIAIASITLGAVVWGYVFFHREATRTACAVAAHQSALQRAEQSMGAKWDLQAYPPVDELVASNFPPQITLLDVPGLGQPTYATNVTTITRIPTAAAIKLVRVDCIWAFPQRRLFTNSYVTYRGLAQ